MNNDFNATLVQFGDSMVKIGQRKTAADKRKRFRMDRLKSELDPDRFDLV